MSILRLGISCATCFTRSCRLSCNRHPARSDEVSSKRQMYSLW